MAGRFWLERFRDGWESCSHKKAVVAAVFTLVWNVSSTVARVWAGNYLLPVKASTIHPALTTVSTVSVLHLT